MAATWTAGITAAAGTSLAQSLFVRLLTSHKSFSIIEKHSGSLCHACAHCRSFPTAAPRKARSSVSDSLSGPLLSEPLLIIGLVGYYPANNLISRSPILASKTIHSRNRLLSDISLSFPRLSRTRGQVSYVLLSSTPLTSYETKDLHV